MLIIIKKTILNETDRKILGTENVEYFIENQTNIEKLRSIDKYHYYNIINANIEDKNKYKEVDIIYTIRETDTIEQYRNKLKQEKIDEK